MARPIWRGAISFGMVSIPIKLYLASESKDVSFNLLHKACHTRVRQQRFCPTENTVIPWGDVVRGYEYARDQYIVLEDADLESVPVKSSRVIEIAGFVGLDEVDPQYYERSYYLEPEEVGKKPYALLRSVLDSTRRVALAKLAIRQKEQLCLLRPRGAGILLHTMFYPDEIRSTDELSFPGQEIALTDRELDMAKALVEMLATSFDPAQFHDEYRAALLNVIEQKIQGAVITPPPQPATEGNVTDLMTALRASIEQARKDRAQKQDRPAAGRRRAAPEVEAVADEEAPTRARRRRAG